MHYILDGYNVIHKTPALEDLLSQNLECARKGLLTICKSILQSHGDVARITVVFDGQSDIFGGDTGSGLLSVIYSSTGEEADDAIVDYLRNHKIKNPVIVSDDNYVSNSARSFKAKLMRVQEFIAFANRPSRKINAKSSCRSSKADKKISAKVRQDITKEYAKHLGLTK